MEANGILSECIIYNSFIRIEIGLSLGYNHFRPEKSGKIPEIPVDFEKCQFENQT